MSDGRGLLVAQCWVRILRHLERSVIQPEADLLRDVQTVIARAETTTGVVLGIDVTAILESLSLLGSR